MSAISLRTVLAVAGAVTSALLLAAAASVPTAHGGFPGVNGKIAYGVETVWEVYAIDPGSTNLVNLTNDPAVDATPEYSPDGSKIAFNRGGEVYRMNADGSDQVNLTNAPLSNEGPSSWSPDGSKILFTSDRDGDTELYVMNADGSNQTRLTTEPGTQNEASWSPDGAKIAYGGDQSGNGEIYIMNADGSNPTNLTHSGAQEGSPDWSPDGTQIVFNSDRDGGWGGDLFVMNADGTDQRNITNTPEQSEQWPAWSPDGTKIASSGSAGIYNDIFVRNADGSNPTDITNTESLNEIDPDWQPVILDTTPPTIEITTPAAGAVYTLGQTVTAVYSCEDDGGVASCVGDVPDGTAIDTASVGAKTFTVQAQDTVGNSTSASHSYTVTFPFAGFFSPVDNPPIVNTAKAGRAIPVKFSLGADRGLAILAAGSPSVAVTSCASGLVDDAIETTLTAGASSLSYDPVANQYVYIWKTDKAWAGTCRQLQLRLIDTTTHIANFKFK